DGTWTTKGATETSSIKSISNIIRPRSYARANLSYFINSQHSFNLNYTFDKLRNETYNKLLVDGDKMPGKLNKQILGVAYQQEYFNKKLTNTWFGKFYHLGLARNKYVGNVLTSLDTAFNNYGYGLASRYKLKENSGIKFSAEHAFRLQEAEEMFGDGLNLQPNPDLLPEFSDNLNLGAYYGFALGKHRFFIEASGFYRNAKDFIYVVPDVR